MEWPPSALEGGSKDNVGTGNPTNTLWIERMASITGFDRLSEYLVGDPHLAPYLLFAAVYVIDIPVLSTVQYLDTGFHPLLANPGAPLTLLGLVFGIWGSRYLRRQYNARVAELVETEKYEAHFSQQPSRIGEWLLSFGASDTTDSETVLTEVVSDKLKLLFLGGGLLIYIGWITLNPGIQRLIFVVEGPLIGSIKYLVIIPIVYVPILVDFVGVYAGVIGLLSLKVRTVGLIDFQDPLGYGGLKPIGELIKSGSLLYFAGATLFIMLHTVGQIWGASVLPDLTFITGAMFVVIIGAGVALFFLPLILLHSFIKQAKHDKIQSLAAQVQASGPEHDEQMFPDTSIPDSVDDGHSYIQLFIKMTNVQNTREYPVDIAQIQEILLAAVVPYVAHVTVSFIIHLMENEIGIL